jgi:hypothetical protein
VDLMYALDLLDGSTVEETLYSPEITVRGWTDRINGPGKMTFSMHKHHPSATDANLLLWRPVRLYRRSGAMQAVWFGFIMAKREIGEEIQVVCEGGLRIFSKRYTGANEQFNGQGSTEAFGLLSDTNTTDGATGISQGTGGVTTTKDITLDSVQILRALEELAAAHGAEFRVNADAELDFVPSLGTDQSEALELIFRRDGQPGSNVLSIEIAEEGEPMANKIIGTSSVGAGLTSTYTHPTSLDTYPVLIERKAFNHANDQGTLNALTEAYGLQRGLPIPDFQAMPATATKKFNPLTGTRELSGLDYTDVSVGDLVTITIVTENRNESVTKRIAELIVDVDQNMKETMRFTLSEAGIFVTESYLASTDYRDVKRRLAEIEHHL